MSDARGLRRARAAAVLRLDHRASVADTRRAGRHVERQVLGQAVTWHVEDRVVVEGPRTIVFA